MRDPSGKRELLKGWDPDADPRSQLDGEEDKEGDREGGREGEGQRGGEGSGMGNGGRSGREGVASLYVSLVVLRGVRTKSEGAGTVW